MVTGRWAPLPRERGKEGKGSDGRAVAVSGERPIGDTSCRKQHNQVSCQPPLPRPEPRVALGPNMGMGTRQWKDDFVGGPDAFIPITSCWQDSACVPL